MNQLSTNTNQSSGLSIANSKNDMGKDYLSLLEQSLKTARSARQVDEANQLYRKNVIGAVNVIKSEKMLLDVLDEYEQLGNQIQSLEDDIESSRDALHRMEDELLVTEDLDKILTLEKKIDIIKNSISDKEKKKDYKANLKFRLRDQLGMKETFIMVDKEKKDDDKGLTGMLAAMMINKNQQPQKEARTVNARDVKTVRKPKTNIADEFGEFTN